jgi:8-oxo-dGTP pyrophosphatase MutT (NUDIX family)
LPKGHLEEGETSTIAAVREIFEETGITVSEMIGEIGSIDFNFEKTAGDEVSKKVDFFLFKINIADTLDVFPSPDEVVEIGWFSIDEALRKADYENIKGLLESADKMIGKKQWN